ncbi:hypothetical protein K1T71_002255 [Dendrolimus kikuchii]|uniref:Uncharacterized protein n=1 Tax=Dendrolimus kikuchii TaxID=765133 RepID=A0ACC1DC69_9NEOP|nr:hypothetical protein K1T71_002255 [Dendrolimus kikuchii]
MAYPNHAPPPPPPQTMGSTNTVFITETRFDPSYLRTPPGMLKAAVIVRVINDGRSVYWCHFSVILSVQEWRKNTISCGLAACRKRRLNNPQPVTPPPPLLSLVYLNIYKLRVTLFVCYGLLNYLTDFNQIFSSCFFGYLAMVVYGVDAFLKAKALKAGELAQGRRVVTKQTHVTTPPALP